MADSGACGRGSWQPWQVRFSPGCNWVAERIEVTAKPLASSAWKNNSQRAGTVKWALPSASTGTVPSTARAMFTESCAWGRRRPVSWGGVPEGTDIGST